MKFPFVPWLIYAGGLTLLITIDALGRKSAGTFGQHGLWTPDILWFGVPSVLGVIAVFLLWHSTRDQPKFWRRIVAVGLHALIGFVLYAVATGWYVLGSGVDSL